MEGQGASLLGSAAGSLAKGAAAKLSRRSFLGKVGRYALVAAGSTAAIGFLASPAQAHCLGFDCGCGGRPCDAGCGSGRGCPSCTNCSHSVTCQGLTGTGGQCPARSSTCGSWTCSCNDCPSGLREWVDCCSDPGGDPERCVGDSSCQCVTDTDGHGDGCTRPTCCYRKCYPGGSISACRFIVCRFSRCA